MIEALPDTNQTGSASAPIAETLSGGRRPCPLHIPVRSAPARAAAALGERRLRSSRAATQAEHRPLRLCANPPKVTFSESAVLIIVLSPVLPSLTPHGTSVARKDQHSLLSCEELGYGGVKSSTSSRARQKTRVKTSGYTTQVQAKPFSINALGNSWLLKTSPPSGVCNPNPAELKS